MQAHLSQVSPEQIEALFFELVDLPATAREAKLAELAILQRELRDELYALLSASDQAKGFLSCSPIAPLSDIVVDKKCWTKQNISCYRLIRHIGQGGMANVYLAERADGVYQKQVAIKLVNHIVHNDLSLRRFKFERQILANLQHPNIAHLLDGGTTEDGYPYLVMEYIQGEPIDRYCKIKQLSTKEILTLVIKVCKAVQYAHQNLIVHRDLKPDNILITADGSPKLLDFGIAKLLESDPSVKQNQALTLASHPLMTPEYASPEQVLGEAITTSTDVYALGVILYELLTGQRPYQFSNYSIATIAQTICEKTICPPSQCKPEQGTDLRGDLDTIVLFALRKEPELRYQSVNDLIIDLQRYLDNKPVSAVKSTLGYRTTKFVKRHKLGVGLGTFALSILIAGIFVTSWQWHVAREQQKQAERYYTEVRNLANTVIFEVTDAVGKLPGSTRLRQWLMDKGVVYLDRLSQDRRDDPNLQHEIARAYFKLSQVQGSPFAENLGNPEGARESLMKSLAIWEMLNRNDPENLLVLAGLARTYLRLSAVDGSQAKHNQALDFAIRCITLHKNHIIDNRTKVKGKLFSCYAAAAHWMSAMGQYQKAKHYLLSAVQMIGTNRSGQPHRIPFKLRVIYKERIYEELAQIAAKTGHLQRALAFERKRLKILQTLPDNQLKSRRLADSYHAVAARLATIGNINNALQFYQKSLVLWSERAKQYPEDLRPHQDMAGIYAEMSKWHATLASQVDKPDQKNQHQNMSCTFHQRSQQLLERMPESGRGFGTRQTWLQSPAEFLHSQTNQCKLVNS